MGNYLFTEFSVGQVPTDLDFQQIARDIPLEPVLRVDQRIIPFDKQNIQQILIFLATAGVGAKRGGLSPKFPIETRPCLMVEGPLPIGRIGGPKKILGPHLRVWALISRTQPLLPKIALIFFFQHLVYRH